MQGFQDCVKEAWNRPIRQPSNPMLILHTKLSRTGKALRIWARNLILQGKLAMAICREVILQLHKVQEERILSTDELMLRKTLKQRVLGLAAIEKARARHKSCIT